MTMMPILIAGWMPSALPLVAVEPTWTDKEVLLYLVGAVGATLVAIFPFALFAIKFFSGHAKELARKEEESRKALQKENQKLREQLDKEPGGKADLAIMQHQIAQAREELAGFILTKTATEEEATKHRKLAEQLTGNLESLQSQLANHQGELQAERRRIKRALDRDGHIWVERVLASAPEFKSLNPDGRRMPILSVLNLKGGVGKTTLTANLGAALHGLGYRVLLIDLDLQGSLTGLFLPDVQQLQIDKQHRLVQDFLVAAYDESPNLIDEGYTHPILEGGKSGLVPTSDSLAYVELNLTIRWMLREKTTDPRFLLRKELQLARIMQKYDIVLLDCPPLFNVSCVNALAASDYLLIPVMPSTKATARVPILLKRLKQFRENIIPDLNVMGVVANRTFGARLTAEEENRMTLLRSQCKDAWGHVVTQFNRIIPQSAEVRASEDENRPLRPDDKTYQVFLELAKEVHGHLPTFCPPLKHSAEANQGVSS